uniref:F-box only protein 24-like isoform X1 n=1 Tax=Styela clava TaxID=7725 RepID=UPI0019394439|nr:F-box only protein 24-like isoform X1 [Styela clava]
MALTTLYHFTLCIFPVLKKNLGRQISIRMDSSGDMDTNAEHAHGSDQYTFSHSSGEMSRKRKFSPRSSEDVKEFDDDVQVNEDGSDITSTPTDPHSNESKRCCRKLKFTTNTDDSVSPMLTLPNELLAHLVQYLKPKEIGGLSCTCRRICSIIGENFVWRNLSRSTFPVWNDRTYGITADDSNTSTSTSNNVKPYVGNCWKRQYVLNSTKALYYQSLGSSRGKNINKVMDTPSAYGFKKMCCSRDHVFALDFSGILHVYRSRWERDPVTNEFTYKRASWHREFSKHVVDVTTDPRYDNTHRRYVYVLSQSNGMLNKRSHPNTRSSNQVQDGWNKYGVPSSGDKIDVFDERSCRRVFNMTFDPEMRFTSMKLTSAESQQKTLFMLTDAGKVYSLHLFEPSLLNLGTEGIQVTLKSASKCLGEKVKAINTSVGIVSFITVSGKVHIIAQRPGEFYDLFGRENSARLGVPLPIQHIAKVVQCSIGDRHMGFLDEYGRAFVLGNNRCGQLGTGDRMDRTHPTQVLCNKNIRILHCSLNHTLAVVESWERCSVYGTGCGNNGRLPGRGRGSVEFLKLDIKIPWSTRQIDTHKECVFVLSCCDIDEENLFEKRNNRNDYNNFHLLTPPKNLQELLMDMKKASRLGEKVRILEAMIDKIGGNFSKTPPLDLSQFKTIAQSSIVAPKNINTSKMPSAIKDIDVGLLRHAAELLRHEVERVQLDVEIMKKNHS